MAKKVDLYFFDDKENLLALQPELLMSTPIKSLAKNLILSIPYAREKYFQREFVKTTPSCKGAFKTFAEAIAATPSDRLAGYNHKEIPEAFINSIDELNPCDYPVLYWLSRLLPKSKVIFELGGSMGKGYYSYRKYLSFPEDHRWTICEVPATVEVGREIARQRNEPHLFFTDERQPEQNPDLYTTFGALQYIEESFAEIIAKLRVKPPHLLVNRVPMTEGKPYITLQNNGRWFSPYRVDNVSDFIKNITALDYELVDKFEMNRPVSFLLDPEYDVPAYHGMYFRLK
jgi:putative methyltransferase (TIGR04325 family)